MSKRPVKFTNCPKCGGAMNAKYSECLRCLVEAAEQRQKDKEREQQGDAKAEPKEEDGQ